MEDKPDEQMLLWYCVTASNLGMRVLSSDSAIKQLC